MFGSHRGHSVPSHPERIGYAIDVIEPGRDERDLQYSLVGKSGRPQMIVILSLNAGGVFSQLDHVVKHDSILIADGGSRVVPLQRIDQLLIQRYSTQKLCVRLDSIDAPVCRGDQRRYHLVLASVQREVGRHECPKGRKGVIEGVGYEAVRRHYARSAVLSRMDWIGVLHRVQLALPKHGLLDALVLFHFDDTNPGHLSSSQTGRPQSRSLMLGELRS